MRLRQLSRGPGAGLVLILAVGLSLRVVAFLNQPSIGLDEARLALNIASRSYAALAAPLDYDQSAPLFFLWIEKFATALFGVSDFALRLIPLAAGIGAVLMVYPVFSRVVSRVGATIGAALVACSPVLVYYAIGVKQYGVELLVTLVLVYWSLDWLEQRRPRSTGWLLLVGGIIAVWVSGPGVFVLGAIGIALVWSAIGSREWVRLRYVLLASIAWLTSFAAAYAVTYSRAAQNAYLQHYWRPALLTADGGPVLPRLSSMLREAIWGIVIGYPGTPGWSGATLAISLLSIAVSCGIVVGAWQVARRYGAPVAIVVAGPLALAICASLLGFYPLVLRLGLFGLPLVQLLVISAIQWVADSVSATPRRAIWSGFGLLATLPLLIVALLEVTSLNPPEHLRPVVEDLTSKRRPGEPVYVFAGSLPLWAFYSTDWAAPDRDRLAFLARIGGSGGVAFENAPGRPRRVEQEGWDALYDAAAGRELYGIPTGIEWRPIGGVTKRTPDPGWAAHEADRIAAAATTVATSNVWVIMSHVVGREVELFEEIESRGARRTYVRQGNDSYLARYTFPR